jgi:hypothetical protein
MKSLIKWLQGKKTYLISIGWIIYGVLYTGFHTHKWTSFGGAITYLFSGAGAITLKAGLARYSLNIVEAILGTTPQSVEAQVANAVEVNASIVSSENQSTPVA